MNYFEYSWGLAIGALLTLMSGQHEANVLGVVLGAVLIAAYASIFKKGDSHE